METEANGHGQGVGVFNLDHLMQTVLIEKIGECYVKCMGKCQIRFFLSGFIAKRKRSLLFRKSAIKGSKRSKAEVSMDMMASLYFIDGKGIGGAVELIRPSFDAIGREEYWHPIQVRIANYLLIVLRSSQIRSFSGLQLNAICTQLCTDEC